MLIDTCNVIRIRKREGQRIVSFGAIFSLSFIFRKISYNFVLGFGNWKFRRKNNFLLIEINKIK